MITIGYDWAYTLDGDPWPHCIACTRTGLQLGPDEVVPNDITTPIIIGTEPKAYQLDCYNCGQNILERYHKEHPKTGALLNLPIPDSLIDNKPAELTIQFPAHWIEGVFEDWMDAVGAEAFVEYLLANEGARVRMERPDYDNSRITFVRDEHPFVTPFFGSTWIEGTRMAAAVRKTTTVPVLLSPGDQFLYDDQLYVLRSRSHANGLPSAHQAGHETGVLYIFHPEELPNRPCTPTEIGEAYKRRVATMEERRKREQQRESARVPLQDCRLFHAVEKETAYAVTRPNESMWIAATSVRPKVNDGLDLFDLALHSPHDRRQLLVCMPEADWKAAIGQLLHAMLHAKKGTPK